MKVIAGSAAAKTSQTEHNRHSMIGGAGVEVGCKAVSRGGSKRAGPELFKYSSECNFQQAAQSMSAEPSAD